MPYETYTADTLPLELKGKVMSLNVLENKMLLLMTWVTRLATTCSMSYNNTQDYTLYQVKIDANTKRVHVLCLGMYCVDSELKEWYESVDDLPKWVQEKLALLMMLEPMLV